MNTSLRLVLPALLLLSAAARGDAWSDAINYRLGSSRAPIAQAPQAKNLEGLHR